jgi:coenzyme F420-reducing hydrogenase gamma subunit
LLDVVDIVQFREAISERGEDYAVAFVEGSITRESDEERLKAIRAQAAVLVALGACAHLGGVNAIKNLSPLEDVRRYVYGDKAHWYATYAARPISAVVPVDAFIPGCPIDREEFVEVVKALLHGKKPPVPDYPLCVECKLKENVCMFDKGGICLGPITRAGCNAICPSYGDGCEGCRGLISHPNRDSMLNVLAEHGLKPEDIAHTTTMFGAFDPAQLPR